MQRIPHSNHNNHEVQEPPSEEENNGSKSAESGKSNKIRPLTNAYIKENPTWTENLKGYFSEYCSASGIHGVRYLGESGRFLLEKLMWAIILIGMCYFCTSLILKAYSKWRSSPVIVTFATTETPIWKIPFPAVTICPDVKNDPSIFNYSDIFLKKIANADISPKENEYFEGLSLICPGLSSLPDQVDSIMANGSLIVNWTVIANTFSITPPIVDDELVIWAGFDRDKNMFTEIYTNEGLCYTFNMIDPKELRTEPKEYKLNSFSNYTKSKNWSLEHGYANNKKGDEFPRRTFVSGTSGGLIVQLLTNSSHIDRFCSDAYEGYQVVIHNPSEFPNTDASFRIPLNHIASVAIKPKMITVAEQLKTYEPEYRNCYFANERHLKYFHTYSQQNCLEECLTNFTIKECGCVAFYMPKSEQFPICGVAKMDCVELSKVNYLVTNPHQATLSCNCMPACTTLEYEVEISQTSWPWYESFRILKRLLKNNVYEEMLGDVESYRCSRLIVYFKEMQFLALERHELYGKTEFFSNTGGLLGLFLGFSITSAIEILYFLTLRIICNIKKFGADFWSGRNSVKSE